jgi:competence protein ComEA
MRITTFVRATLLSLLLSFAALAAGPAVNINTADATQLASLNGIGDSKAQAIIAHRQANGPFKSIDQLAEVKGIGLKTVDKNRERLTIGGSSQAARAPVAANPSSP